MGVHLVIEGVPHPQLRPRATRIGNSIRLYDPKTTSDYKKYVKLTAKQQWEGKPLDCPLVVEMDVYRQIPKSTSKKRRKLKNERVIRPVVKPDVTNYAKGIEDALNGIVYKDDSQIVELTIRKFYSDNPRVEIEIKKQEESFI